eukprot:gene15215-biopygen21700
MNMTVNDTMTMIMIMATRGGSTPHRGKAREPALSDSKGARRRAATTGDGPAPGETAPPPPPPGNPFLDETSDFSEQRLACLRCWAQPASRTVKLLGPALHCTAKCMLGAVQLLGNAANCMLGAVQLLGNAANCMLGAVKLLGNAANCMLGAVQLLGNAANC